MFLFVCLFICRRIVSCATFLPIFLDSSFLIFSDVYWTAGPLKANKTIFVFDTGPTTNMIDKKSSYILEYHNEWVDERVSSNTHFLFQIFISLMFVLLFWYPEPLCSESYRQTWVLCVNLKGRSKLIQFKWYLQHNLQTGHYFILLWPL